MPHRLIGLERHGRGLGFDRRIAVLAPMINSLRSAGVHAVHAIMKRLNEAGVPDPNGGAFTYGTTYRVLRRMPQLGLGPGPRSVSTALSQRPYVFRQECSSPSLTLKKLQQACDAGPAIPDLREQNHENSP
jgi:hypothetical protein